MHYDKIPRVESKFLADQFGGQFKLKAFDLPIPGESLRLLGYTCRRKDGDTSYFYSNKYDKEKVVLHFTAGNLQGDLPQLTQKNYHVSVAFVIARNGAILQLFGSNRWSYHLGPGAIGGNRTQSRKSIGIELSNYGP